MPMPAAADTVQLIRLGKCGRGHHNWPATITLPALLLVIRSAAAATRTRPRPPRNPAAGAAAAVGYCRSGGVVLVMRWLVLVEPPLPAFPPSDRACDLMNDLMNGYSKHKLGQLAGSGIDSVDSCGLGILI